MIYEVAAAVEHIVSLIQGIERDQPVAPETLAGFASTLKDALEKRCQRCWKPADPECGSAQRSVAWQLHPTGEGADHDLLRAFASVIQAHAEEGEIVHLHQANVVALALNWLPLAFTIWIDPGCVAVRRGSGPGANRSSYDFDHPKSSVSSTAVHVIWGQMIAHPAERHVPQLTVSSAPRPIPIVRPTPTAAHMRYPVQAMSSGRPTANAHHYRALSSSSSASSSCDRLVRSVSLSSTHTVSTDATSLSGLESCEAESETCPSLCSPSSTVPSSQCTPSTDNGRESVHDTTIGDATERFAGVRLFDDDADQEAGDITIHAGPMLGLNVSKGGASQVLCAGFVAAPVQSSVAKSVASSASVKCNYTTHDNGNVGVLGGGVRLGGSSNKNNSAQPPRHRQHSNSKSISHLQGGLHNQLFPPYVSQPLPHQMPRQLHHINAANYSAPMRTVPLPALSQHYQQVPSHLGYQQQQQQFHALQPQRAGPMMAYAHASQLPTPYGFRTPAQPQHQPFPRYAPQQQGMPLAINFDVAEGEDEDSEKAGMGRRRLRSRGRRSRGRGAGRAARRQAAALRALELGSTDELHEFGDDDDFLSRCSTPATSSEYTCSEESCYSSATSSPAKPSNGRHSIASLSHNQSHIEFGIHLHSSLARLEHV